MYVHYDERISPLNFQNIPIILFFSILYQVNNQDNLGETPMHKAGRKNYFEAYKMMQNAGGSDSIKNNLRETPKQLMFDGTIY